MRCRELGAAMRRRKFIALIGGISAAWPLAARAQQPTMPRICVLSGLPESDPEAQKMTHALVEGLSQLGWKRDENVHIDIRWGNDPARLQQLAKELVELRDRNVVRFPQDGRCGWRCSVCCRPGWVFSRADRARWCT